MSCGRLRTRHMTWWRRASRGGLLARCRMLIAARATRSSTAPRRRRGVRPQRRPAQLGAAATGLRAGGLRTDRGPLGPPRRRAAAAGVHVPPAGAEPGADRARRRVLDLVPPRRLAARAVE